METIKVGTGTDALTFSVEFQKVERYFMDPRLAWQYTVTDSSGAVLTTGSDLSTPITGVATSALDSLLAFAGAAAESHRYGGNDDHGFPTVAAEAFAKVADELSLATME